MKTLGWRREGFYAFANGIYNGVWQPVDDLGITSHKDKKYFSPAFSVVYADVMDDADDYQNDRYFIYNQSPITFGEWTMIMSNVYGKNSMMGISYAIATCFRDLIYEKYKCFPHLFLFGEV
ncbi:MAG: DNA primase, partial [Bacteroidetes bacterium]|nr:DNA primase [Bacteroidota bacterium]